MPPVSERMSEESERYFDKFRQNRTNVPSSYNSVKRALSVQLEIKSNVGPAWLLQL